MNTDDILQRCLEDLASGHQTPAQCAAQFPQVPGLLKELLAAQALLSWPPPTIDPATARRHQAQLRAVVAARAPARRPVFALPRWALAAALVFVLVLSGAGTLSAAASSLPGEALYPVKRGVEAMLGAFTPASRQAAWHAGQAEARTGELEALAGPAAAETALLESLAVEIGAETEAALAHVSQAPAAEQAALLERILAQIERQQAVLMAVHERAPQAALAGLERALAHSRLQREAALAHLSAIKNRPNGQPAKAAPNDRHVPPGHAKKTATAAATDLPPGQAKKTATAAATDLPPGQARRTATVEATQVPPGQTNKTATAAAEATAGVTATAPGNSGGQGGQGGQGSTSPANCNGSNPNAAGYCTPTPSVGSQADSHSAPPPATEPPPPADPIATPCPVNPAGQPVCSNRP